MKQEACYLVFYFFGFVPSYFPRGQFTLLKLRDLCYCPLSLVLSFHDKIFTTDLMSSVATGSKEATMDLQHFFAARRFTLCIEKG